MKVIKKKDKKATTRYFLRSRRIYEQSTELLATGEVKLVKIKKSVNMADNEKPQSSNNLNDINSLAEILQKLLIKNDAGMGAVNFDKIIPEFDGKTVPIKKWLENFESNAEIYGVNEKQKYVQARNKMTGTAKIFLDATTVTDFKTLKHALCEEFHVALTSADVHDQLRKRKKKADESFHEYVLQMTKLAKVGDVEEASIIKYVVDGLQVDNEAKYLLHSSKTTKQLRENYEIAERLTAERKASSRGQVKTFHIDSNKNTKRSDNKKPIHCFNCGSTDHKRSECTNTTKCFRCNEYGHIAKSCGSAVKNVNTVTERKRIKNITLCGLNLQCLVDTGADVTILKNSAFKKINGETLQKSSSVLRGLGNIKTHPVGEFTGETTVDDIVVFQKFVVVPDDAIQHDALLGYDFIKRFHFTCDEDGFKFATLVPNKEKAEETNLSIYNITDISTNIFVPPQHSQQICEMIAAYDPKPEMKCPVELTIVPDGELRPFRHSPSRLPPVESEAVKKQVDDWLRNGIIRKSHSRVASRVVIARKKCGAIRVCVDYRQLNKMVLKDCFPVPVMEDIFAKLQDATYFTVMDLQNGFFHVPIAETSKEYTAFVTKEGLFEFNVAPFGFCNSPAAFIRFVSHIFQDLVNENFLELYMDDLIVFSKTIEEGLQKLACVLRRAEAYNLKIKWEKCSFIQTKISFLGHIIESGKIQPGEEKVSAVKNYKIPKNIKAVQAFLGLTGFFRRFIEGYASIARPLTNLLKKEAVFKIGPEEINAIERLKQCLTTGPVLRIFCREAPTELCTDASKEGFGAVLLQEFEGAMHPVFYWSKKASPQEGRNHSYILEVKAAFLATKKFRNYLLGIKFKLVTDCSAFKQTLSKRDVPREVGQWILYLQDFDFQVEYRPGKKIKHADFLSRITHNVFEVTTEVMARIKRAQARDDHIRAIAEILHDRPYEGYKIKGNLIFKNVEGNEVLVVPKCMEEELIKDAHNVGHYSSQKTIHALQQQYYIPHVEKKVNRIIENCVRCIIHNKKLGKKEGLLHCIDKGDLPLHTLHVDHLGPMDATSKLYKFIFAIVDGFTKFVWLYPTKTTGADEVLRKLKEWSNTFGNPIRLISDQGSAFTSNAFKAFMEENRIEHILTTTGVARGNGQVERVNRSILSIIAKLSSEDSTKWYKHVGNVQTAINMHVHSSTKSSPFQLMFGVKMRHNVSDDILQMLEEEIVTNFDKARSELREDAKRQIQEAQATYKRNHDKKCKQSPAYKNGDLVAIKRSQFVAGRKLASNYIGPYEIVKVKRNGHYDVRKAAEGEGPNLTSTSVDNIKLWRFTQENNDLLSSGSDDEVQDGRM